MNVAASAPRAAASADAGAGIAVHDATVTYRNGHTALRDASFEIPTGTITALVGVNGSGKSTLFKAIMGFVRLAKGEILVLGMPADGGAEEEPRRLCAAGRGGRLELSGAGRGRRHDGPLRPYGHDAHPEGGRSRGGYDPRSPVSA